MLNHLLAVLIELGSLSLFLSGFFLPEVRRKPDLAWSGVGFLYALVLWSEGNSTSGGALLGHMASVALILWFGGQTLQQRREFAAPEAQTAIPNSFETLMPFLKAGWGRMVVAYGEASDWVKAKLGQDDGLIAPEGLTPPSQTQAEPEDEWDIDENSDSESTDGMLTESAESAESAESPIAEPPPAESPTITSTVVSDAQETEIPSSAEVVGSHEVGETEHSPTAIADPPFTPENNTVEVEESFTTALNPEAAEPISERVEANPDLEQAVVDHEDTLPVDNADPTAAPEPSAPSAPSAPSPEDDGSWPPPDPVT